MNEETKKALLDEIKGLIADSGKEGVKKADLDARIEKLNTEIAEKLDNAGMKELKESVDKLLTATADNAAAIKALTEAPANKTEKPKTFKEALIAAVMEAAKKADGLLEDVKDSYGERKSLRSWFTEKGHQNTPVMKVAVDMLESNIVQSNVSTVRLTELDPQRVGIPLTIYPHVIDWVPSRNISRPTMSFLVVYTYEDGSGTKTEGSASSQSSFLFKTVEIPAFTIATYFTLSNETLDDLEEAMSEIAATAPDKLLDAIDGKILSAAGDDSTDIAGLFTANKMTAFASTWDGTIADANIIDLVEKMKLQAESNKYKPDVVGLNPTDLSNLASKKDQLDNSLTDRRVVYNVIGEPTYICGLRVIKSTAITADTGFVADSKQLRIGNRKGMTMTIGYNGTDLTEGQKTVVLEMRVAFGVRDKAAVIYSSGLAADVTAITA